jgi:hypothetical protein
LDRVRLTSRGLRAERDLQFRKAQWLAKWKAKLIADLNLRGFPGPVTDINGSKYPAAIHKAVDASMELKLQYGTMPMDWTRLPPKMLLTMSTYFLAPPGADVADRQWLCAIFAEQTAQPEAARALAAQAAQAKPAYAELVPMFFP